MKKLLFLLAACFVMVACGSDDKKGEQNPAKIYEQMYDAMEKKDEARFVSLYNQMMSIASNATAEQEQQEKEWREANPQKYQAIEELINEGRREGVLK